MRKLLVIAGLALACWAGAAEATNQYEPSHLLSTIWGETSEAQFQNVTLGYVTGDTLYSRADTLGPVFVGHCRAVLLAASWIGDSTTVAVQASVVGRIGPRFRCPTSRTSGRRRPMVSTSRASLSRPRPTLRHQSAAPSSAR